MSKQAQDTKNPAGNGSEPHDPALGQLEYQVERGSFFTHTALGRNSIRLGEVEAFAYGLIDVLLAKGIISSEEVKTAVERVRQELTSRGDVPGTGVALRMERQEESTESTESTEFSVKVDCAARMNICRAVCCKLDFALSKSEVESGKVKWDLGRPYFIRHAPNGYCVHNDCQTGGCKIYSDRPAVCRGYSCAGDRHIWNDYEKMELNAEWIEANLTEAIRPHITCSFMQNPECPRPG